MKVTYTVNNEEKIIRNKKIKNKGNKLKWKINLNQKKRYNTDNACNIYYCASGGVRNTSNSKYIFL